ncbi:carbohydrate sulfotransferase 3-like [Ptychodera flava]|uniref:carbohydrate sulfotransferase 3-like n=1 Tax=Ptychodera flava TaxID=63121 RepID=UPI003969E066
MESTFKKPVLFFLACLVIASSTILLSRAWTSPCRVAANGYALSRSFVSSGNTTSSHDTGTEAPPQPSVCPTSTPRKHVLFVAKARTGSTFIGELFNQNPNVFYLFEPLRVVPDMVKMDAIPETYSGDMSAELLNSFYHCDFLTYYVYHIPRWYLAVSESNAMQKICKRYKRCTNVSISDLKEECLKYEVMVIKSIRVEDLNYLMPMLQQECFDFKVVLLARDPRAVASSRKYFKYRNRANETLYELGIAKPLNDTTTRLHPDNVHDYCKWLGRNLAVLRNAQSRARRRIVVLRYEDVVANVTQKALELYKIFGSRVTENVLKWIADNTHSDEHVERGSMATKRNSTSTALAWRSDLSMNDVKLVQSACNDVMQTLGYKLIKRESELINTSASLLNPLPLK